MSKLDQSKPLKGQVFGGWDDFAVKATQGFGAKFDFRRSNYGFIRQETAGFEGTPVIFTYGRWIRPGTADEFMPAVSAMYENDRQNQPKLLASTCSRDENEPNLFHILYMWANIEAYGEWAKAFSHPDNAMGAKCRSFFDNDKPCEGKLFAREHENLKKMMSSVGKAWASINYLDIAEIGKIDFNKG